MNRVVELISRIGRYAEKTGVITPGERSEIEQLLSDYVWLKKRGIPEEV